MALTDEHRVFDQISRNQSQQNDPVNEPKHVTKLFMLSDKLQLFLSLSSKLGCRSPLAVTGGDRFYDQNSPNQTQENELLQEQRDFY